MRESIIEKWVNFMKCIEDLNKRISKEATTAYRGTKTKILLSS
jgi:hypothetical protein